MPLDIIAIGGGSVLDGDTESIDRAFLERCGAPNPNLLFVPTASRDAEDYVQSISTGYSRLGARVQALRLWNGDSAELARKLLEWADTVYVGGGNTKEMLQIWRDTGFAELLVAAAQAGKPVGGLSAGALCWFRVGNSDWPQYEGIPGVMTDRLECLGLVDLVLCPHASAEPFRLGDFREMMKGEEGVGLALDDCCAIHVRGDSYRVLASHPGAVAHRIAWVQGELSEQIVEPFEVFRSLAGLTN